MMMTFLMTIAGAHASFPEDFGDLVGPVGCSAAWNDYCEAGWSAQGAADTSDMAERVSDGDVGVMVSVPVACGRMVWSAW
jgi:hypothetical protein